MGQCDRRPVSSRTPSALLRVRHATRTFGRRRAFTDVSFEVPAGGRLLLAGGNGAGKTTLLRCLAGTLAFTDGTAEVAGRMVGTLDARRLVGVCLAPERSLYEQLSARDNLLLAARIRLPARDTVRAVTGLEDELGLGHVATVPVSRCSAGMRARVTVARALVGDPALVLLDEPTRALDDDGRARLWAALERRPGLACVLASHHAADTRHCHEILTLPVQR
jgi:ABC-type multidrug transport system ATPase subunit